MKKHKIDVHMGTALFTGAHTLRVQPETGAPVDVSAHDIVVATGARAALLPGVEADGRRILTYPEAILQETLPASVVVIGGSAIGLEFATVWNSYGSKVTIVEMLPRLAPLEDEEIGKELAKAFTKRGIDVRTGSRVEGITASKTKVTVKIRTGSGEETIEADQALVAVGIKPNTEKLGLEAAGVKLGPRGHVEVDERMATHVAGVWAIGDVTGKLALAHVGSAMGIVCAENIAGVETVTLDYEMMPRAIYSQPQVAAFGLTEAQARERGHQVKVGRFPFQANGKALGLGDYAGWAKIVTDAQYGEILGAHLVGPEVTELLPELTLAQRMELTTAEIARNVHAHPTLSEALMEAAHDAEGHAIHI
jgi:dihydrolipoamide dehydrogenase